MTDQLYDKGPLFWTHSLPYDEETAVRQFEEKFGYKPELVERSKSFLYLGPVVVSEDTDE
jgi:hypothetical protein